MISMHGVPSSLIARNTSWVRQEAATLARKLPSNVERADLIQAGLIAVAQAALSFEFGGSHETEEAREAFVRYARSRVRGAMIDELRAMDVLPRGERRKIKAVDIARERWLAQHGRPPTLAEVGEACGLTVDEVAQLDQSAAMARTESLTPADAGDDAAPRSQREPATPQEEVEARVDTGLLMQRLEAIFAALPETDRQVIDAYLGVGMTPGQLAASRQITPSRIAQMYGSICRRIAVHMGTAPARATDRVGADGSREFQRLVKAREAALEQQQAHGNWGALLQNALGGEAVFNSRSADPDRIVVGPGTRW